MVIKVGINGFGRIGRIIFRTCCQTPETEVGNLAQSKSIAINGPTWYGLAHNKKVAAINDPAIELEYICYLMKFDSTHGKHNGSISYEGDEIKIDGHSIKVFHHKDPSDIPWQEAGVRYVVEASGMFTNLEKASGHLASDGVKRVLVTAPSADVPMIILGVNEDKLNPDLKVISCASSTLYCLAPIVKVLQDAFGVAEGFVTSIHAMTPSLKPLDGLCIRGKHWRDHRSIHQNIIPAATGACKALGRILPAVRDRLTGLAFRVPIVNVSVLDLSIRLEKSTSINEITQCIEKLKDSPLHNIMQVSKEQAVSSDFIGDKHSCTLDVDSSLELRPNFFKLVCWYENEYSYACRVVDTILHSERRQLFIQPITKMPCVGPRSWESCKTHREAQQTDDCRKHVGIECISFPILLPNPCGPRAGRLSARPVLKRSTIAYPRGASQLRNPPARLNLTCNIDTLQKSCSVQNKNIFHEKNIAPQKKCQKECGQTQERLEAVKKDLLKMANITESLLKVSNTKKFSPTFTATTPSKEITEKEKSRVHSTINVEPEKHILEFFEKRNEEKQSSPTIESCGDFKTSQLNVTYKGIKDSKIILNVNSFNNLRQQGSNGNQTKLEETNNFGKTAKTCNSQNIACEIKNTDKICSNISWNQNKQPVLQENVINITKENKTESNCKHELGKNFECILIDENLNADEVIHIVSETPECENSCTENNMLDNKINVNDSQKIDKNVTLKVVTKEGVKEEICQTADLMDRVLPNIIELVDEKLKQRNIVLVENENNNAIVNDYREEACRQMHKEFTTCIDDGETSRCVSPVNTVTTISNVERYRSKQDIYDKLDSTSVSGSEISFQMREKKSQIINITDLAYSTEDLARLDKICRIIEISDELSDKLFAPLDCVKGSPMDKKKWSFKDLCEKIKLDEFCNNVFGKSAS